MCRDTALPKSNLWGYMPLCPHGSGNVCIHTHLPPRPLLSLLSLELAALTFLLRAVCNRRYVHVRVGPLNTITLLLYGTIYCIHHLHQVYKHMSLIVHDHSPQSQPLAGQNSTTNNSYYTEHNIQSIHSQNKQFEFKKIVPGPPMALEA